MPGNFKKKDLRVIKTHKSLQRALIKLLNKRNFNRLTVNDMCEEAQLSRTAFYMHFSDKYGLLEYCLKDIQPEVRSCLSNNELINIMLAKNRRAIVNLIEDADYLTLGLLQDFYFH